MIRNAAPGLKSGSLTKRLFTCVDTRLTVGAVLLSAQADIRTSKDPDFNPGTNAARAMGTRSIAPSSCPSPFLHSVSTLRNNALPPEGGPPR